MELTREAIAIHEAGHAVIGALSPMTVVEYAELPETPGHYSDGQKHVYDGMVSVGYTAFHADSIDMTYQLVQGLQFQEYASAAGPLAEAKATADGSVYLRFRELFEDEFLADPNYMTLWGILVRARLCNHLEYQKIKKADRELNKLLFVDVLELVEATWPAIEAVAKELAANGRLEQDDISSIIDRSLREDRPTIRPFAGIHWTGRENGNAVVLNWQNERTGRNGEMAIPIGRQEVA
jgi:hypothetical protein